MLGRTARNTWALVGVLAVLAVWALLSYTGSVDTLFLATPSSVGAALARMLTGADGWVSIRDTAFRWIVGFLIGGCSGAVLGLVLGLMPRSFMSLEVVLDFFRSIPPVALLPLFLLIFGVGHSSKIAVSAWTGFLPTAIGCAYSVRYAKQSRLQLAQVFRASTRHTYTVFILPEALPGIITSLRVSMSLALIGAVAAEMLLGGDSGLGKAIYDSSLLYDTPTLYAGIACVGMMGYGANALVGYTERRFVHWAGK